MNTVMRLYRSVQRWLRPTSLTPTEKKLASDVLHGISEAKSCHLSAIARTLREKVPLIRTEQRLSRHLAKKSSNLDTLPKEWLRHVSHVAKKREFVTVDLSDISKPYGRAFEHLDSIRDGSSPQREIEPGYWIVSIDASDGDTHARLPLWNDLFSTQAPDFQGWFETIHRAMLSVSRVTHPNAWWLLDRGFDGNDTMKVLDSIAQRWLIRIKKNRNVTFGDPACPQTKNIVDFTEGLHCPHKKELPYVDKSNHTLKSYPVSFGFAPVTVDDRQRTLIVVRFSGKEDWLLLTNQRGLCAKEVARVIKAYLKRWGIEETLRCLKQCTHLEDIRVRSYVSLQRMTIFAMIALGLQALWWWTRRTSAERIMKRVKSFFDNVLFPHYRLWEGTSDALAHGS